MVTYPYVVENLALLSLGLLLQAWKISRTIMLCKSLDTGYNFVRTPFTVKVAMIYLICPLLLRCAIYRLPDTHEHITRPPQGVKYPKKVSNLVASYLYPPISKSLSLFSFQFQRLPYKDTGLFKALLVFHPLIL